MSRTLAIVVGLLVCFAVPAAATGTVTPIVQNQRADRLALNAWEAYLQALLVNRPTVKAAEVSYATATGSTCKGALSTIASMSSAPAGSSDALISIGQEIGDDANLEFSISGATAPFARLSTTFSALHWAGAAPANTVKRFVAAEQAILTLSLSPLCADAYWVASKVSSPPITNAPQTTTFLATYGAASALVNTRLQALLKLFHTYETPAEIALATKIDVLTKAVTTMNTNVVTQGTDALFRVLGVPKASIARSSGS